jgi:hypothetical protein
MLLLARERRKSGEANEEIVSRPFRARRTFNAKRPSLVRAVDNIDQSGGGREDLVNSDDGGTLKAKETTIHLKKTGNAGAGCAGDLEIDAECALRKEGSMKQEHGAVELEAVAYVRFVDSFSQIQ